MAAGNHQLYPVAVFLPVAACTVIILDIPPLIWHVRNRNLAACSLIIWLIIFNLFALINSLVWPHDNTTEYFSGHGLCDFEVYVVVAGWTGLCSSVLCIMRNLANVLDTKRQVVTHSRSRRIRQLLVDSIICWAPPGLQLSILDVVKANRYYIYGLNGCMPSLDTSWVSFMLVYIWPLIISIVIGYYAVLVLLRLHRYRSEFSRLIQNHSTTRSHFLRLFLLSSLFLLGTLPTQSILLYINLQKKPAPYSWSRNHDPKHRASVSTLASYGSLIPDRWIALICGVLIFLFFGLGTDASAMYRSWLDKISPARLFRCRSNNNYNLHHGRHRHWPCSSSNPTETGGPISPTRSSLSYKTYLTSTTRSATSTAKSFSKSLRKSPPTFWRNTSIATTTTTQMSTVNSASPTLPTHNMQTLSTASAAPTIDTTISMTPLSHTIRKASVGTLVEDDDGVETLMGSPMGWEKRADRGSGEGFGIDMGVFSAVRDGEE